MADRLFWGFEGLVLGVPRRCAEEFEYRGLGFGGFRVWGLGGFGFRGFRVWV